MGRRNQLLYVIFFCSGASALTFETIWFRQAGLVLGNSVWASSMVLAAFMAGLACGNWLAGRMGHRFQRPIRVYGLLEVLIAISGLSIVLLFPHFNTLLLPVLKAASSEAWLLNLVRLVIGFTVMLLPTAAMGATLPLMVKGLSVLNSSFGERLGRLYACNTLGAVAGTLVAELLLIELLGIRGTGIAAACCSLAAGFASIFCDSRQRGDDGSNVVVEESLEPICGYSRRLLFAAFLAGGTLLALEVVWFRLMLQVCTGTSRVFSVMLSVVLTGIAIGGVVGAIIAKSRKASVVIPIVAACSSLLTLMTYLLPVSYLTMASVELKVGTSLWGIISRGMPVMLPVSVFSGVLFTLIGHSLHERNRSDTRSAGYLTLCNTIGAMFGAVSGGFLLLPQAGLDSSFFILSGAYLVISVVSIPTSMRFGQMAGNSLVGAIVISLIAICLAPHGVLDKVLFMKTVEKFQKGAPTRVVAFRESITGTLIYTQVERLGHPYYQRLITDGHSMSATGPSAWQYMKMYVYLPVAMHPAPRKSLLISYGCGVTAKALTETREFEQIDIVDISKDILDLNSAVYPEPETSPLNDPRVRTIIEDGRYYLQTTEELYDLITSEPPPPKNANIVNLYTREYFQLIHDRLAPGGMTTYWLPQHAIRSSDSFSIIRAFCDVFDDSSMWVGSGDDWMMLGVKDGHKLVSEERFRAQWEDARVSPILAACGFESPEQLVSYFMADGLTLRKMTRNALPLTDNYPHRLSPDSLVMAFEPSYAECASAEESRRRLTQSKHIARLVPETYLKKSIACFEHRDMIHDLWAAERNQLNRGKRGSLESIHGVLTGSPLQTPILWALGSGYRDQLIADRVAEVEPDNTNVLLRRSFRALSERNYLEASSYYSKYLSQVTADSSYFRKAVIYNAYALCMVSRVAEAEKLLDEKLTDVDLAPQLVDDLKFLRTTFSISNEMITASSDIR